MAKRKQPSKVEGGDKGGVVVALRLPDTLVKRADAMVPRLANSDIAAAGEVSRSTVLRLAVMKGLSELEKSYPA